MATVQDILSEKGSHVHCIDGSMSVLVATQVMNQHKIGALVVNEGEKIAGMFTERDVLRRVVAEQRDPRSTKVRDVMTREVICCAPETELEEVSDIMKARRIRHIPICGEEGKLKGMISIGDVNAFYTTNQERTIHFLHEYIYGRA